MTPQELRIGNFIQDAAGNIETVESLNNFGGDEINEDSSLSEYFGIPLTEEWLLKFGATDAKYEKGYFSLGGLYISKNEFELRFSDSEYGIGEFAIELKYVHQLQNLFYCLTGKELSCG